MSVQWAQEFASLYAKQPRLASDVPLRLRQFAGYEEALWLFLCSRHHRSQPPSEVTYQTATENQALLQFRVMRFYSRYSPSHLRPTELENVMRIGDQSGSQSLMSRLVKRYGPEPSELTLKERIIMWYAFYQRHEEIERVDHLVTTFEGHESTLLARLTQDLGPEPQAEFISDPRDPRMRVRRFLSHYDPTALSEVEGLIEDYRGDMITLIALLQRRYGREPSDRVFLRADLRSLSSQHAGPDNGGGGSGEPSTDLATLIASAEEEARRKEALLAKANEILDAATNVQLMPLSPNIQRDPIILHVRKLVTEGEEMSLPALEEVTNKTFQRYDRYYLGLVEPLVAKRFGAVKEAMEWLSLLDCMYSNAKPLSSAPTLRQVLSLIEIKTFGRIDEITVAGGFESFVSGVDPSSHHDWMRYFTAVHGVPDEREIGTRNRNLIHFLYYNRQCTIDDAVRELRRIELKFPLIGEALTEKYGPAPELPSINRARVQRVLSRYAPHRLPYLQDTIDAHRLPYDTPEDVVRRVCRSYGPELANTFALLQRMLLDELEERFHVFATESRMREILARFFATSLDASSNVMNIIEAKANNEAALQRELQLQRIRRQQEEQQRAALAQESYRQHRLQSSYEPFFAEEAAARAAIRRAARDGLDLWNLRAAAVLDVEDLSPNVELGEMLSRLKIEEDAVLETEPIFDEMMTERAELEEFLSEMLPWRAKWAEDERLREERIQAIIAERQQEEANRQRRAANARLVASVFPPHSDHDDIMRERNEELQLQSWRVAEYEAKLQCSRAKVRREMLRVSADVTSTRGLHEGCRFHQANYAHRVERMDPAKFEDDYGSSKLQPPADTRDPVQAQLAEYLSSLFRRYEPSRLGTEAEILQRNVGKERELILGLEQRYDVFRWVTHDLRSRVRAYVEKMAPHLVNEVDTLVRRFADNEETLWSYLTTRFGPIPNLQSSEMRLYLKNRLVRYLQRAAPHLLDEADRMVEQCTDNGDELFARLTRVHGPEAQNIALDTLKRKLQQFYSKRGMTRALDDVGEIAERFVGREKVLHQLMMMKFGDSFLNENPSSQVVRR